MVIAYFVNLGKKFFKTQYFLSKITKRKKKDYAITHKKHCHQKEIIVLSVSAVGGW